MNSDKKQTTQIAILGILLALCAGYVVFKFTGKKPSAEARKPKEAVTRTQGEKVEPGNGDSSRSGDLELSIIPAGPRKDPFEPAFTAEPERSTSQANRPSAKSAGPRVPPLVPNVNLPPLGSVPRSSGGPCQITEEERPPEPEFRVSGIVVGDKNVAIIHSVSGDRQIVREGQYVSGRYKVLSITKRGVILKGDGGTIHAELGGGK